MKFLKRIVPVIAAVVAVTGHADIIEFDLDKRLFEAVTNSAVSLEEVYALIANGADVNQKIGHSPLLLHAIKSRQPRKAFALLDRGADPKAVNAKLVTALHLAASVKDFENVEALIEAGALVDAKNEQGYTPLWYALAHNDIESAKILIKAGADICEFVRHTILKTNSELANLLKRELEGSRMTDQDCFKKFKSSEPSEKLSRQMCDLQQNYALDSNCITNNQFSEFRRLNRAPFCDVFGELSAWRECKPRLEERN